MNKIWTKNNSATLNKQVESFTIGVDYILDDQLLPYDIQGSKAHAKMLQKIGILTEQELSILISGLDEILMEWRAGNFFLKKEDEDSHSAIEAYLTEKFGVVGKKIHSGRSRNDQILVTVRLFSKHKLKQIISVAELLIRVLKEKSSDIGQLKMPGYTHMQRAMPSSVGMWLGSFVEALEDDLTLLKTVATINDQNPLGSAASFGENVLGLDRAYTTQELGFAKLQNNPMYCALSRGKFENMILQALSQVVFLLGKFASDLMLFTTKEFGFFDLPMEFKTGSSMMPQKKNFDVLELIRGNISVFYALQFQIQEVVKNLPSGYNRDFQLTKEPFLKGMQLAEDLIGIGTLVAKNLQAHPEALAAACSPELYETDAVLQKVKAGASFRDAYRGLGS